ncbi:MAG: molybdopterin-dependent oxidoreductase, partial [Sterolibacterium sp.]|nr:molybdopterin-dependent oxidoreductase [Sterolibacterium sp.]
LDALPNRMLTEGLLERLYHPTRIQYPMVRKSYFEAKQKQFGQAHATPAASVANTHPERRGKEAFVRVDWDTALALVAEEILRTAEKHGNEALFSASYSGWSHAGLLRPQVLQGRLFGLIGGHSKTTGNYSFGAARFGLAHVIHGMEAYMPQTSWEVIEQHTELMVLVGCDPWSNNRIDFNVADHRMLPHWQNFAKKGIRFISINPQRTRADREFGAQWQPIRPNTDTALFLAMAHHVHNSGRTDQNYLKRYTVGAEQFIQHLQGKDGTPAKTAVWAAAITGIAAERIVELAELVASKRTQFAAGWSLQRAHHGEMPHWALINLAAMLGKIGKPGEGVGLSWHYSGSGMPPSGNTMPVGLPQGYNPVTTRCPASRITEMLENPGGRYQQNGQKARYPDARLLYVAGNNFMSHQQDTHGLIRALNKQIETVICQEPWWCASARFADIVLPATTALERNDLSYGGSYSSDRIYAMRQVIAPYGESLDDFEIFRRLADLMGVGLQFTGVEMDSAGTQIEQPRSVMQFLRETYAASAGAAVMPFDEFWEKGVVQLATPEAARQYVLHGDFYNDPAKNPLPTPSGRIELYSKTLAGFKLDDCPPLPTFLEPAEYLGNAQAGQLHVVSPHPYNRLHSQMANSNLRLEENIQGRSHLRINTQDAAARGIVQGDLVELYNARGRLLAGAQVTDDIMPGVVSLEEGNWLQLDRQGRCNSGAVNVLTTSIASSQLSQATAANTCLASLKKCNDAESPNRAFEPPTVEKTSAKLAIATDDMAVRAGKLRGAKLAKMSKGEKLFFETCTRCHAAYAPAEHTRKEWQGITEQMFARTQLSAQEKQEILNYLNTHAKDAAPAMKQKQSR